MAIVVFYGPLGFAQAPDVFISKPTQGDQFKPGATVVIEAMITEVNQGGIGAVTADLTELTGSLQDDAVLPTEVVADVYVWAVEVGNTEGDTTVTVTAEDASGQNTASSSVTVFIFTINTSGSLTVTADMVPEQSPSAEAQKFILNVSSQLRLNFTFSGLVLSPVFSFNNTVGLKRAVLDLRGILGNFDLRQEVTFDTPLNSTGAPLGTAAFVKHRFVASTNISGATLKNTTVFEDVDFPGNRTDPYDVGFVDSVVNNQTPTFRFGDLVSVDFRSAGGIRASTLAGFCSNSSGSSACNEGPFLVFDFLRVGVSNVKLDGLTLSTTVNFKPDKPLSQSIGIRFGIGNFADVRASLSTTSITELIFDRATLQLSADNLRISVSLDNMVAVTRTTVSSALNLNGFDARLNATLSKGEGLTSARVTLVPPLPVGNVQLRLNISFGKDVVAGGVSFKTFSFSMSSRFELLTFTLAPTFDVNGNFRVRATLSTRF